MKLQKMLKDPVLSQIFKEADGKLSWSRITSDRSIRYANWLIAIFIGLLVILSVLASFIKLDLSEDSMSLLLMAKNTFLIVIITLYTLAYANKAVNKRFETGGVSGVWGQILEKLTQSQKTGTSGTSGSSGQSDGDG